MCYNSNPTITNSTISNNTANQGGGIMCDNSSPITTNLTITDNSANYGGGISSYGTNCNPIIVNLKISNNSANYDGGGIYCAYSVPTITNTIINENSAESGGGIHIYSLAHTTITNTNIYNNSADYGGGVWCGNASFIVTNSIVANNSNYGIYFDYGNHSLTYSNFWNNNPENFYNCDAWVGVNVTVNNNNDSIDPYGNIQLEPMFVDTANGDYHFLSVSPCIDAGVNDSVTVQTDMEGNIRIWDGNGDEDTIVDMGTYEFGSQIYTTINNFNYNFNESFYKIYPNPSKGLINIRKNNIENNSLLIRILDINGRVIDDIDRGNKELYQIDLSIYCQGVYFIKLITENNIKVKKVIIY